MDSANQCDRCKTYYTNDPVKFDKDKRLRYITLNTLTKNNMRLSIDVDLCKECATKLINWLKGEIELESQPDLSV